MATDLAHQPIAGAPVQACGDCHLMNFGAFNSPEDNILFDINDFDETLPGVDFTVDLKRLAASVAVAAGRRAPTGSGRAACGCHGHGLSRAHGSLGHGFLRSKSGTAASISSRRSSGCG